jgi:hypothetical protein
MSLKDVWLAGKRQRQQQLIERQQVVQQMLTEFNQTRQYAASELHSDLTLFRERLSQQNHHRQSDFRAFQIELQAFYRELQCNMRSLRNQLNLDLATLKIETQLFLAACQQQRGQTNVAVRQALSEFIENLRTDTHTYLAELELLRQQRTEQIQQHLQTSRQTREADVAALFAYFVEFRAELEQFHRSLSETVWGQSTPTGFTSSQAVLPQQSAIPTAKLSVPKPLTPVAASRATSKTSSTSKPVAAKSTLRTTRKLTSTPKSAIVSVASVAQSSQSPLPSESEVAFEKEVYNFLYKSEGGRLTQIETALNLNRFQAVDALRSLIKKGLITQRERVYLVQHAM